MRTCCTNLHCGEKVKAANTDNCGSVIFFVSAVIEAVIGRVVSIPHFDLAAVISVIGIRPTAISNAFNGGFIELSHRTLLQHISFIFATMEDILEVASIIDSFFSIAT